MAIADEARAGFDIQRLRRDIALHFALAVNAQMAFRGQRRLDLAVNDDVARPDTLPLDETAGGHFEVAVRVHLASDDAIHPQVSGGTDIPRDFAALADESHPHGLAFDFLCFLDRLGLEHHVLRLLDLLARLNWF